jgi:hypothetical protein
MKQMMSAVIAEKEISVSGNLFKIARLRHEWCDFLEDPPAAIQRMQCSPRLADLFTFVQDICDDPRLLPFYKESASLAVLRVTTYQKWWDDMGFKARNKVRKGQKSGVNLRAIQLDDDFAKGVEGIYNETPVKQGRRFYHYGKRANEIKDELSSFLDRCLLIGAYYENELVGFMKLFRGKNVLRTIHIIAKLAHRDKCVMDALIAKAVELCDHDKVEYLQYGSWSEGGVGDFRAKHGFQRVEVPRYFVPLTARGKLMLKFKLHRPIRDLLPQSLVRPLIDLRSRLNSIRYRPGKVLAHG